MISDVLIIGGGVIGLSIARELHKKGVGRIMIVERGEIGKEASYAAAGMLAPNAEADGLNDFYRFCSESNKLYSRFADELFAETGVNIELDRSGTLYLAFTEEDSRELNERFEWQSNAALDVEHLSAEDTLGLEPFMAPDIRESLFFPGDGQVENRKLLSSLVKYAELTGIELREHTEIQTLLLDGSKITGADSNIGKFHADLTILATGAWTSLIKLGEALVPVKVKPVRGQMISFHPAEKLFQKVIYSPNGYIVPRADGKILVGATVEDAGFNKAVTDTGVNSLIEAALEIAPTLGGLKISGKWVGLRPFAMDGFPYIGEIPGYVNLLIATAHYRNGILLAPLTAKIMAERIVEDNASEYMKIFSPQRHLINGNVYSF